MMISSRQSVSIPPSSHATTRVTTTTTNNSSSLSGVVSATSSSNSESGDSTAPPSQASTTSAFLLGMHNYEALDDVNLPEFVQEHQATLTFPEKLMLMLTYIEKGCAKDAKRNPDSECLFWILEGRAFVIRNKEELVKTLLPLFFRQAKFASFTRKLYRWGFRQISMSPERFSARKEMIFGHEFFQRDNKPLMSRMRSVTAAGTRRAMAAMAVKQQKKNLAAAAGQQTIEHHHHGVISSTSSLINPTANSLSFAASLPSATPFGASTKVHQQQMAALAGTAPQNCLHIAPAPPAGASAASAVAGRVTNALPTNFTLSGPTLQEALKLTHQQRAMLSQPQQLSHLVVPAPVATSVHPAVSRGQEQHNQAASLSVNNNISLLSPAPAPGASSVVLGPAPLPALFVPQHQHAVTAAPGPLPPPSAPVPAAHHFVSAPAPPPPVTQQQQHLVSSTTAPAPPPAPQQSSSSSPPAPVATASVSPASAPLGATTTTSTIVPPVATTSPTTATAAVPPPAGDANTYMRAAVDMLLRYAS